MLNRKKGPAVWVTLFKRELSDIKGPRAQIDRKLYKKYMQEEINAVPNLTLVEASVSDLLITPVEPGSGNPLTVGKIQGIALGNGEVIHASQVIITTGTFLGGEIHIGIITTLKVLI